MTERVEEIRRLSPWIQKGETPKEWAHRWKCSCQGSVSDECKVLREAFAQADREREALEEKCRVFDLDDIGSVIHERDAARAEVERLKEELRAYGAALEGRG